MRSQGFCACRTLTHFCVCHYVMLLFFVQSVYVSCYSDQIHTDLALIGISCFQLVDYRKTFPFPFQVILMFLVDLVVDRQFDVQLTQAKKERKNGHSKCTNHQATNPRQRAVFPFPLITAKWYSCQESTGTSLLGELRVMLSGFKTLVLLMFLVDLVVDRHKCTNHQATNPKSQIPSSIPGLKSVLSHSFFLFSPVLVEHQTIYLYSMYRYIYRSFQR